jgi:sphinganine-1-phosphate aldolase
VLGEPKLGLVAFTHPEVDVFAVYRSMYRLGWFTSLTTHPKALHLMLSPFHAEVTDAYLRDLKSSVEEAATAKAEADFEARYS